MAINENPARLLNPGHRAYIRRWIILCKNGVLITNPLKKRDAEIVAEWCDKAHRDCRPHTVEGVYHDPS